MSDPTTPSRTLDWLATADRTSEWSTIRAVVVGIGVAGFPAAAGLLQMGADVLVLDDADGDAQRERATILEVLGATVRLGPGTLSAADPSRAAEHLAGVDLVVTSPGFPPDFPLHRAATAAGLPILGEIDLAWRLRDPAHPAPWIGVTGTNGKTTTVEMLAAILSAAGLRTAPVGNIGVSVVDTVLDPQPYDVLAVELSSHQLHWSPGLSLRAAAVLNIRPDHLAFHGDAERYTAAKQKIYHGCEIACVYNVAEPVTEELVRGADVVEGCRAIGFTTGIPAPGMVGVVDDVLADRAFVQQRRTSAAELVKLSELPSTAPHNVANAAAAAALARAHGVPVTAVRDGLAGFRIGGHRTEEVAVVDGVRYVDDSKATNGDAAEAGFGGVDGRVVWIAGGQAKGQRYEDMVSRVAGRLRGVVLLGVDREVFAEALAAHAPDVPVTIEPGADADAMGRVVRAAAELARPGDTVLLAPAAASKDMFIDYAARGDAFAAAVHRLAD